MRSMTGFATETTTLSRDEKTKSQLTLSLKSLNARFFETTFKLPYALNSLETDIQSLLKEKLIRGNLFVGINMSNQHVLKARVEPSLEVIAGYLDAVKNIKKEFNPEGSLTIDTLVTLPNVFTSEEVALDEKSKQIIFNLIASTIQKLITAQEKEGATLLKDITYRLSIIQKEIDTIQSLSVALVEAQKQKIAQTMKELGTDESKFADAQKNALFAYLDKIDIHEEIVRFKSHLEAIQKLLQSSTIEKGKRLDFTLQELGREINTITAKCSDATISSHAINIKVELEKIREQIQNIV